MPLRSLFFQSEYFDTWRAARSDTVLIVLFGNKFNFSLYMQKKNINFLLELDPSATRKFNYVDSSAVNEAIIISRHIFIPRY